MAKREHSEFAMTLYDYKDSLNWVRQMGWSDDELRQVPVYEQAPTGQEYINLANFGGTPLGVSANAGGGTSGSVHGIRNMYVPKDEVPSELWSRLVKLSEKGGPSAYEDGEFGERGNRSDFPPR